MPAISRKRRWRKSDDSEIVAALHRQTAAAEISSERAEDYFEEDLVGKKSQTKTAARLQKQALVQRKVHQKDLDSAARLAAIKTHLRKVKAERKRASDLWGVQITEGKSSAPLTKRFAKMPAVVAPKHGGISVNPEKGEWLDNLAEQAALAREFFEQTAPGLEAVATGSDTESSEGLVSEKSENPEEKSEAGVIAEVKEEIPDEVDEAFAMPAVKPKRARNPQQQHGDRLKRMRSDLKALPKILQDVDSTVQRAANTRAYKASREAERERLLSEGILPDGHIKVGRKKYIESGSDVILPADLELAGGSLRKLVLPPSHTALRERAASFIKRGMTEIVRTRVCKKINAKVHTRIRPH